MKTYKIILFTLSLTFTNIIISQNKPDSLGLPGDNFDLYGALEVFSKAKTPEDFEKAINLKDNEINNLDLDGDGKTDYVRVIDKIEKSGHTLIMQVDVSETETQDIAVIEIDKTDNEKAHVQIVGDEQLYGKDYIIEPSNQITKTPTTVDKNTKSDDVYSTNDNSDRVANPNVNSGNTTSQPAVVNVWAWPSVQYIYTPNYIVYASPWRWRAYPGWWSPWQPIYWRYHYRQAYRYHHPYYYRANYYRSPHIHTFYYGRRNSSNIVQQHRESGFYRERQQTYKINTQPRDRYNNKPAQDKNGPRKSGETQKINESRNNANPKINESQRSQENTQQKNNTQQKQPRQNAKPRQNVQQKQPRVNSAPTQRSQQKGNSGGRAPKHR